MDESGREVARAYQRSCRRPLPGDVVIVNGVAYMVRRIEGTADVDLWRLPEVPNYQP